MSGGQFNYSNDGTAREIFGWRVDIDYDLAKRQDDARFVARVDPLKDRELSELAYDLFCLLHSYDWYRSGDTGEECYRRDVEFFKQKWLGRSAEQRVDFLVDRAIERVRATAGEEISALKRIKGGKGEE